MKRINRYFRIEERGSKIGTEVRAGVATFLTMAYILFVNPQILQEAGMPAADVTLATALAAALATLVMGLYANYPFALASGMGLNAFFAYSVVIGMGVSYQTALAAVFVEGVIFLLLTVGGIRTAIIHAIPISLKQATTSGIGLFLALIGFQQAGFITSDPATIVGLGDLRVTGTVLALVGIILIGILMVRRVLGAILIGIVVVTVLAWIAGVATPPTDIFSVPGWPEETFLAMEFELLFTGQLIAVILAFLFVDFFDTAGTLIGVGNLGGFLNEAGELENADEAFTADAVGTIVGSLLGTSTVTTYVESATGVEEGGRTGLTAIVVALLFLLALFFTPVFVAVPPIATAPALIVVGALMMQGARNLDWSKYDEAIPAFLTITTMAFTYSIANGIVAGIVSFVLIKLLSGKPRDVHWVMYILAALLMVYYGTIGGV